MTNLHVGPDHDPDDLEKVIRVNTASAMEASLRAAHDRLAASMSEFADKQRSRHSAEQSAATDRLLRYYDPMTMQLTVRGTIIPWNKERSWIMLDEAIPTPVVMELAETVVPDLSIALGTKERTPDALAALLHELGRKAAMRN